MFATCSKDGYVIVSDLSELGSGKKILQKRKGETGKTIFGKKMGLGNIYRVH